jgi:hypothetical protein
MKVAFMLDDPDSLRVEDDIFTVVLSKKSLQADARDRMGITAYLRGDTPEGSTVSFHTDNGRFASIPGIDGTSDEQQTFVRRAAGRKAEALLVSSLSPEPATINVSIGQFSILREIRFERALPARLVLSSNAMVLIADGSDTVTLTARLYREEGEGGVSIGTRVVFTAVDLDSGSLVPELEREATSNSDGLATVNLTGRRPGMIEIRAQVVDSPSAADSLVIEFQEP